jgi:hypothetical protein
MLVESYAASDVHYPQWNATTPAQMITYLYGELTKPPEPQCPHCYHGLGVPDGGFMSSVAVLGNRPKGMAFGEIYLRPIGTPRIVGHCSLLYVEPKSRAGRGTKAIGVNLLKHLISAAVARYPDMVLEGSYVPGTHGARLWPGLGLRDYVTYCAYVDGHGTPKLASDLFGHRKPRPERGRGTWAAS